VEGQETARHSLTEVLLDVQSPRLTAEWTGIHYIPHTSSTIGRFTNRKAEFN